MATINQIIFDRSVAHQHNVISFSRMQAKKLAAILIDDIEELKKEILLYLHDADRNGQRAFLLKAGIKELNLLEKRLTKIRNESFEKIRKDLLSVLFDFMATESDIQKDIIYGDWYNPIVSTQKQNENYFLLMMILGKTFEDNFKSLRVLDIDRIMKSIKNGISQQLTDTQIVNSVVGTAQFKNTDGSINTSYNQLNAFIASAIIASQSAVISNYNKANAKTLIMYGQFVAILDSRTSAICQSLSGKKGKYEDLPHPPLHPNAVVKGTLIKTKKGDIKVEDIKTGDSVLTHDGTYCKVYSKQTEIPKKNLKREIRIIKFSTGRILTVTPDHPLLSDKGWISAGNVSIGDNMIQCIDKIGMQNSHTSSINTKQLISKCCDSDVFDHISGFGMASSAVTFNNKVSARDKKITYETSDYVLMNEFDIRVNQSVKQQLFGFCDFITTSSCEAFKGFSSYLKSILRVMFFHSFTASMQPCIGIFSKPPTPRFNKTFGSGIFKNFARSFTLRKPSIQTKANSTFSDDIVRKSIFPFNLSKGFTTLFVYIKKSFNFFFGKKRHDFVPLKVTEVKIIYDDSPYYNLSVEGNETYIAENIVTHNCRSHIAPYFLKVSKVPKSELGGVPQETDYQKWLKRQPEAVQEEILGVTRTKLLRSGKLTFDQFYSRNHDLYTLKELYKKYGIISESIK